MLDKYILAVNVHIVGAMVLCSYQARAEVVDPQLDYLLLVANVLMPLLIAGAFAVYMCMFVIPGEVAKLTATPTELLGMSGQGADIKFAVHQSAVATDIRVTEYGNPMDVERDDK